MIATLAISLIMAATPQEDHLEYIGDYTVSAYNYYEGGGENYTTASGVEPEPYTTIAMKGYPYGTELYIEDIGVVRVDDTGAFPPDRIDLHIGYDDCEAFGLQEKEVYKIVRAK